MIPNKVYVVRKYITAKTAKDAIRLEKSFAPDDVWVDDDWKKNNAFPSSNIAGFKSKKPS